MRALGRRVPFPAIVLATLVLTSVALNPLLGRDPNRTDILQAYRPPSREHWFGTDGAGRDVFARTVAAAKLDVGIAVGSSVSALLIGAALGAVSAYAGGRTDQWFMRLLDVWQAVPGLLLGLLLLGVVGEGLVSLIIVIGLINIPVYARLTRAELLPLRRSSVVEAARQSDVAAWKILFVYFLPSGLSTALAYLPVQAGFSTSIAAGFGFIGLGVKAPAAEWGTMIAEGVGDLLFLQAWWTSLFPGLFLVATVASLYALGDFVKGRIAGDA